MPNDLLIAVLRSRVVVWISIFNAYYREILNEILKQCLSQLKFVNSSVWLFASVPILALNHGPHTLPILPLLLHTHPRLSKAHSLL
jgi:hypothetical protein